MNLFIYLTAKVYTREFFAAKRPRKLIPAKVFEATKRPRNFVPGPLSTARNMCPMGLLSAGAFIRWGFYPLGLLSVGAFIRWGFLSVGVFSAGLLAVGLLSAGLLSAGPLSAPHITTVDSHLFELAVIRSSRFIEAIFISLGKPSLR